MGEEKEGVGRLGCLLSGWTVGILVGWLLELEVRVEGMGCGGRLWGFLHLLDCERLIIVLGRWVFGTVGSESVGANA